MVNLAISMGFSALERGVSNHRGIWRQVTLNRSREFFEFLPIGFHDLFQFNLPRYNNRHVD